MPPQRGAGAGHVLAGRRVLVLRNDRIGDLVLALPLVQALKDMGAFVGVLASPYAAPLLRCDPRVDALVEDGPGALQALRREAFDTALVLWARWGNAWLARSAGIPRRLGPSLRPYSPLFTATLPLRRGKGWTHESEWNLEFGRALGYAGGAPEPRLLLGPGPRAAARAWLRKNVPAGRGPLVALHPGHGGSAQPWPADRFAALGRELRARHGARLLVTGGPADATAMEACLSGLPGAAVCAGLDLEAFAGVLGEAALFAAGSTGPLHVAAAMGTPVLGFYPPLRAMAALRWAPRGSRRAVLSPAGLGFRIPASDGTNHLERISVAEAAAACGFLLETGPDGPEG